MIVLQSTSFTKINQFTMSISTNDSCLKFKHFDLKQNYYVKFFSWYNQSVYEIWKIVFLNENFHETLKQIWFLHKSSLLFPCDVIVSVEEKKLPLIVDNIFYSVTPTGNISYGRSIAKKVLGTFSIFKITSYF